MDFEGAVVKEQGITFAIVIVKPYLLTSTSERERARNGFQLSFPGIPLILMAQDHKGIPTYHGRPDIVRFLANIHPSRIPWKKFHVS